jgi:hypothetical protein
VAWAYAVELVGRYSNPDDWEHLAEIGQPRIRPDGDILFPRLGRTDPGDRAAARDRGRRGAGARPQGGRNYGSAR